jgi:cyclic pyranopterin phosphate synthase
MLDRFNRQISYLRISITDRCNLRCAYCMPEQGISLIPHAEILRYEEILEVVQEAAKLGIDKVRITGGEPLVRKGVENLVAMISEVPQIKELTLTTNGVLLEEYAGKLAVAGLHRINVSLDTVDPVKYYTLTRGGYLHKVLRGITAAKEAGLNPVKINCVVAGSSDDENSRAVKEYCEENGLEVRFIRRMDLENGCFSIVEGGTGGDCQVCNRLRLTADGYIKPCLFDNLAFSIREMGVREALYAAIGMKPEKGTVNTVNRFNNIGG